MVHLSAQQGCALAGQLPLSTIAFLRETGVPEAIEFRGIKHAFTLEMELLLGGQAFQIGSVDDGWYFMALWRDTGHFGYVFTEQGHPSWCFCNSSLAAFLDCFAAFQRVWQLEVVDKDMEDARGKLLEAEISRIDPVVFADENNIWSFLVEESLAGVV